MEITAFACPAEAYARISLALAEIRKFLIPDSNDQIRQVQMREIRRMKRQVETETEQKCLEDSGQESDVSTSPHQSETSVSPKPADTQVPTTALAVGDKGRNYAATHSTHFVSVLDRLRGGSGGHEARAVVSDNNTRQQQCETNKRILDRIINSHYRDRNTTETGEFLTFNLNNYAVGEPFAKKLKET